MLGVAFLVLFGGMAVVAIVSAVKHREARASALDEIAKYLGGVHDRTAASGTSRGLAVKYRFETRGSGSSSESWTEVEVAIPAAYPLSIHVRRHGWRDGSRIAADKMIDVVVGDPEFDRAFLVEAAPTDVIRNLLDGEARALLSAHDNVELDTVDVDGKRVLRFAVRRWVEDLDAARTMIEGVVRIGANVRDAFAAAGETAPAVESGGPYRASRDEKGSRDAGAVWTKEVAQVETVRAARFARSKVISWIVVGGFVLVWIAVAGPCHR